MTSEKPPLLLYHTDGCHLCELAQALVAPLAEQYGWRLQPVEIAHDEQLMTRFATRIPVLENPASAVQIGWPFGPEEVRRLIAGVQD